MANAGEVSVALNLDDADFLVGLEAARTTLEAFSREIAQLALPPELSAGELLSVPDTSAAFAVAGAQAGTAFNEALAATLSADTLAGSFALAGTGAGAALTAALTAGLAGLEAQMTQTGTLASQALAQGMAQGQARLRSVASGLMQAALNAASSSAAAANGIGLNFASGLAAGIRAGRSGVISAAIAVAQAAVSAARSALSIHSPSRVTERLGRFFDLGFIEGVRDMTPDIERSVRAAVRLPAPSPGAVVDASTNIVPARPAAMSIDYNALAEAMMQYQPVLVMNSRRVAEIQTNDTARTQSRRARRVALGYGK